jgi:deoxyxylulose-5-phosphate synthase
MRAYDGSGGQGGKAFSQDVNRIEQNQAESDAMMTGDVMNRELQQKRQQLTQLLSMATQLGDAESARLLTSQLQAIQSQMQQSNFYDTMGYNYAGLNQQGNLQSLMAMLGSL